MEQVEGGLLDAFTSPSLLHPWNVKSPEKQPTATQ